MAARAASLGMGRTLSLGQCLADRAGVNTRQFRDDLDLARVEPDSSAERTSVDLDALPLSSAYVAERGSNRRARLAAATGGDDYALLAALPAGFDPLSLSLPSRTILARIGTLAEGREIALFDSSGDVPMPEQLGYEHHA